MSFALVSAGVGVVSLGAGLAKSIGQSNQADQIYANNQRPQYDIPPEFRENVAMAKHMAQIGLPQQQYNNQVNAIGRNQAGAIGALSNSANPGANLAAIIRAGNDATGNLNAQDANARQNNQRYAIGMNAQLGQQKIQEQQYNKFDKYTEDYNKSAALRGAAGQNFNNALSGAAGMATNLYGMGQLGAGGGDSFQPLDLQQSTGRINNSMANTTNSFNQYLNGQQQPQLGWGKTEIQPYPDQFNYFQKI